MLYKCRIILNFESRKVVDLKELLAKIDIKLDYASLINAIACINYSILFIS